jgi:CBS domain containing-hemolysin-like protein
MKNFIGGIPDEIEESGRLDGANDFLIFVKLYLPLLGPSLASIGLFIALGYWNQWHTVMLYIDDENLLEEEVKIFQNALDFRNVKVRDCIVPRTEIVAVSRTESIDNIRNQFVDSGISKIIVYDNDIDHIVGFLHSSEMFRLAPTDDWTRCIRETPIVPETMSAQKLLSTLMTQKKSLAVVVDEFGGTSGIVTVEDLVEEIFGEIEDEHDTTTYIAKKLPNGEYHISARMEIEKVNDLLDIDLPESDDYITVGGWVLKEFQSFPKVNEVIECGNWKVKVVKKTSNKIEEVIISRK